MSYEEILSEVIKPARYIGGERNCSVKVDADIKMAIVFPDSYEIGMSHAGTRIIYDIINNREDALCERVFAPWPDFANLLRKHDIPLASLETYRPLGEFDIIGFTLPYELTYANILEILSLGNIPAFAKDRQRGYPIVLGGGSGVFNPEPVADFFDAFFLGDAEEGIHDIIDSIIQTRSAKKNDKLSSLAQIPGIYVPSYFDVSYDTDGRISSVVNKTGKPTQKRVVADLDRADCPKKPIVPLTKVIHDRVAVEVSRGCSTGCRFCQAGFTTRPVRERSPQKVFEIIKDSVSSTGDSEFSMSSLNIGEYSCIVELSEFLSSWYKDEKVSFSIPSVRVGTLSRELASHIKSTRKSGITIAPEAGSERLRMVINKYISEDALLQMVEDLISEGWKSLKLYFMIGLPTETDEDLEATVRLVNGVLKKAKESKARFHKLKLSFATFVPKPHTPFQWAGQIPIPEIIRRQAFLRDRLKKGITMFETHSAQMSHLEAVLSRGDRRLSSVIYSAWKKGALLDAWTENFDFGKWTSAFEENGIDPCFYANRDIDTDEILPWDHIDSGIKKEFLVSELKKSEQVQYTKDCKRYTCTDCGACGPGVKHILRHEQGKHPVYKRMHKRQSASRLKIPHRYILSYRKQGRVRFLSHLDLINVFLKSFRVVELPMVFSQGFNPQPRVSYGPPLSVGLESRHEFIECETAQPVNSEELMEKLNAALPEGISVFAVEKIAGKLQVVSITYEVSPIPGGLLEGKKIIPAGPLLYTKKKSGSVVDIKPYILRVDKIPGSETVEIQLKTINGVNFNIIQMAQTLFELPEGHSLKCVRTRMTTTQKV